MKKISLLASLLISLSLQGTELSEIFSSEQMKKLGLEKLSKEEQSDLLQWIESEKQSKNSPEPTPQSLPQTIRSVNSQTGQLHLLDASIWEVSKEDLDTVTYWYPGQKVYISPSQNGEYPFLLLNHQNRQTVAAVKIEGSIDQRQPQLSPSLSLHFPIEQATIIKVNEEKGSFLLSNQTSWLIAPLDREIFSHLSPQQAIQFQKSDRRSYPFTFKLEESGQTFMAKRIASSPVESKSLHNTENFKKISDMENFGEIIILDDTSRLTIANSDLDITYNWKEGDQIETRFSERSDYPIEIINRTRDQSAKARLIRAEEREQITSSSPLQDPTVETVQSHGRYLYTDHGELYEVAPIDRGRVDFWIPQQRITVDEGFQADNRYPIKVTNLNRKESARVRKVEP